MTIDCAAKIVADNDEYITCLIDNKPVLSVQKHIEKNYADTWTLEKYKQMFPDAPLLSQKAKRVIAEAREKRLLEKKRLENAQISFVASAKEDSLFAPALDKKKGEFHVVFGLGRGAAARNSRGEAIEITTFEGHKGASLDYLPATQDNYVYDIDLLKKVIIGLEMNMPIYLWGYHGTGKTTIFQQAAARTGRPFVRVQHTLNMQESDVTGQWTVRDGSTVFQPGPLVTAMVNGWVYCADEYDFAMPAVTAVYQPVLEGNDLIIKDAPPQFRRIIPHPDFRFVATGNTNGGGDESGLYSGTQIMNAANFSRFGITEEVVYMAASSEEMVLKAKTGIDKDNAKRLVSLANTVRKEFSKGSISSTISPRELIAAANLGIVLGGKWADGLCLAFTNRLSRVDKQTVNQLASRIFE